MQIIRESMVRSAEAVTITINYKKSYYTLQIVNGEPRVLDKTTKVSELATDYIYSDTKPKDIGKAKWKAFKKSSQPAQDFEFVYVNKALKIEEYVILYLVGVLTNCCYDLLSGSHILNRYT